MTIQVVFWGERGGVSAQPKLLLFPFNKLKISVIPSEARNLITLVCNLLGLNSTEKIKVISSTLKDIHTNLLFRDNEPCFDGSGGNLFNLTGAIVNFQ